MLAPHRMDSLPEQRIEALPGAVRREAYDRIGKLCVLRLERNDYSEDEIAERLRFGSAEAMHHQLKAWGLAGLLPTEEKEREDKLPTARGGGERHSLRPAAEA